MFRDAKWTNETNENNMIIYQIVAKGSLVALNGSGTIVSKEIYTSPPSQTEKDKFLERCIKCDGAADLNSLDPDHVITITIVPYELINNG